MTPQGNYKTKHTEEGNTRLPKYNRKHRDAGMTSQTRQHEIRRQQIYDKLPREDQNRLTEEDLDGPKLEYAHLKPTELHIYL